MKYKVILIRNNNAGVSDDIGNFSFYKKSVAEDCCEAWLQISGTNAWLWDGTQWNQYT